MLDSTSFEAFKASAAAAGFDETLLREWGPGVVLDTHVHDFFVEVVVARGEMWLTHQGRTVHLMRGGRFTVPAGEPHAERYGDTGTDLWVARRRGAPQDAPHGAAGQGAMAGSGGAGARR